MEKNSQLSRLLKQVADMWLNQVEICKTAKARDFGDIADEVMKYVGKRYAPLGGDEKEGGKKPDCETRWNMTQTFISVMAPYVFAQVPNRLVQPRRPQVPPELARVVPDVFVMQDAIRKQDTMLSFLLQWWLNWIPKEYNLSREGRIAVQEALAKGRGCIWCEMEDGPTGPIPTSYADSVDNLFIDADAKQLRDAGFIIRRRTQSIWKIAQLFGQDPDKLRGRYTSALQQAANQAVNSTDEVQKDVADYYEIWSVMGLGHKLVAAPQEMKDMRANLDEIGPYCWLAVMPGVDYPLNLDPDVLESAGSDLSDESASSQAVGAEMQNRLQWPIAFYHRKENPWPVNCLDFLPNADSPWPTPPLAAALPLQRFVDRVYATMMNRIHSTGRDIILVSAALEQAIHDAIVSGKDQAVVKSTESLEELGKMVHILQFPEMNGDVYRMLEIAERAFEKITGLDPSIYGGIPRTQDRSAAATNARQGGLSRRPDDYADAVEAWMSAVSSSEAVATRLLVDHTVVAPLFGESIAQDESGATVYGPLTTYWIELVMTDNPAIAAGEMAYTVEAGSGRRKNKQLLQANAEQLFQMLAPQFGALLTQTGNPDPYMTLLRLVGDAFDMPVEPLIESYRQAIAQASQQPQIATQPQADAPYQQPA
jgi:hypothetical protein